MKNFLLPAAIGGGAIATVLVLNPQKSLIPASPEQPIAVLPGVDIDKILEQQGSHPAPIRIVVAMDFTGSREKHRILSLTLEDLQPLFALLKKVGGEIAFLAICESSNRPALRLHLESPPRLNAQDFQRVAAPVPPDKNGNPFQLEEQQKQYEKEFAAYNQIQLANQQKLEAHKQQLARWQSAADTKIQQYQAQLKPLLSQPSNCQHTDIGGAVTRANLFLAEDTSTWSVPPKNYAVFITDGLDTVGQKPVAFNGETEVFLVNGSGSKGVLAQLPHKSFESPTAAFRYLSARVNSGP